MLLQYWLPSGICTVAAFALLLIYSAGFIIKTGRSLSAVNLLSKQIADFDKCDIANVAKIGDMVLESKSAVVKEAWERFSFDIKKMFDSVIAPQPNGYFTYDDIFAHPAFERKVHRSWKLLPALALISLLASPTILAVSGEYANVLCLQITIGASFVSLILIVSMFTIAYSQVKNREDIARHALFTLNRTITGILPTATESAQAALLLTATSKNTLAFEKTAADISAKIDTLVLDRLIPLISGTFDSSIEKNLKPSLEKLEEVLGGLSHEVVKRQEDGMKALADSFSEQLSSTMQSRISALAETIEKVNAGMREVKESLAKTAEEMTDRLSSDRLILNEAIANVSKAAESQQRIADNITQLATSVEKTENIIVRLDERDGRIFAKMDEASARTEALQQQLKHELEAYASDKGITLEAVMSMSAEIKAFVEESASKTNAEMQHVIEKLGDTFGDATVQTNQTLEKSITEIKTTVAESICGVNDKTVEMLGATVQTLKQSFGEALRETNETVTSAIEHTNQTVSGSFVEYSEKLLSAFERSAASNETITADYAKMLDELSEYAKHQYEKTTNAETQLMANIAAEMSKTLGGVGGEIYKAIMDASVNTSEIVERLAETTEKIKSEYDFYFTRVESQNQNTLNDMEFHMQAVLTRFSEEAGGVMDKLENSVTAAMGMFQSSTAELLSSLSDEARSIGLYTKDLNLDVADLSNTLKESVQLFTESMNTSTEKAFAEFDNGLSDITLRFANTIESVRESVENLPKALEGRK